MRATVDCLLPIQLLALAVLLAACPPNRSRSDDDTASDDDGGSGDGVRLSGIPAMPDFVPAVAGVARYEQFGMSAGLAGGQDADCAAFADYVQTVQEAFAAFQDEEIAEDEYMALVLDAAVDFYGLGGPIVSLALGTGGYEDPFEMAVGPWPAPTELTVALLVDTMPEDPDDLLDQWLAWDEDLPFSGEVEAFGGGRLRGWYEVTGVWVDSDEEGEEVTVHVEVDVPVCDG